MTVLAGGSYVRCFNVVSGGLQWESSVSSAVPSHHASLQFVGFGEFDFSQSVFHVNMIKFIFYCSTFCWWIANWKSEMFGFGHKLYKSIHAAFCENFWFMSQWYYKFLVVKFCKNIDRFYFILFCIIMYQTTTSNVWLELLSKYIETKEKLQTILLTLVCISRHCFKQGLKTGFMIVLTCNLYLRTLHVDYLICSMLSIVGWLLWFTQTNWQFWLMTMCLHLTWTPALSSGRLHFPTGHRHSAVMLAV